MSYNSGKNFKKKNNNRITSLKMLVVGADGLGEGLNRVKPHDVTYGKIRKIIGGPVEISPFKMVYQGKKYWMIVDESGMVNGKWEQEWFMPFTAGMIGVDFVYKYNDKPAHIEDLNFNGIQKTEFMGQYAIPTWGPVVFIEDIGDTEIFSDHWQTKIAS